MGQNGDLLRNADTLFCKPGQVSVFLVVWGMIVWLSAANPCFARTMLNVSSFSGTNASAKISACVAALPVAGGVCDARGLASPQILSAMTISKPVELLFGQTKFAVTGTIQLRSVAGARLLGVGGSYSNGGSGTQFVWAGNSHQPMFDLNDVRDSLFAGFYIDSSPAKPLAVGIRSENGSGRSVTPTRNEFRDIVLNGTRPGGLGKGFQFALGKGGDANNDLNSFINVEVVAYTAAAWSFEQSQSKDNQMFGCSFNGEGFGKYGVTTALGPKGRGGSFMWYGGSGGGNTVADFYLGAPDDAILISGGDFEGSFRLLETAGSSSNAWPVEIDGVRWANNNLAPDGKAVVYTERGPLILLDDIFEPYSAKPTAIALESTGPTQGIAIGNSVTSSLSHPFSGNRHAHWMQIGNLINNKELSPSIYGLIEQGLGAPSGPCKTGTLYSRTDGKPGSTLYVCEAGAWVAQ